MTYSELDIRESFTELRVAISYDPYVLHPSARAGAFIRVISRRWPTLCTHHSLEEGTYIFLFASKFKIANENAEFGVRTTQARGSRVLFDFRHRVNTDLSIHESRSITLFHGETSSFVGVESRRKRWKIGRSRRCEHICRNRVCKDNICIEIVGSGMKVVVDERNPLLFCRCQKLLFVRFEFCFIHRFLSLFVTPGCGSFAIPRSCVWCFALIVGEAGSGGLKSHRSESRGFNFGRGHKREDMFMELFDQGLEECVGAKWNGKVLGYIPSFEQVPEKGCQ